MASLIGSSTMAIRGLRSPAITGRRGVRCSATFAGENHYKTLSLRPGASEKEVKKAFRKLALKVCFYPVPISQLALSSFAFGSGLVLFWGYLNSEITNEGFSLISYKIWVFLQIHLDLLFSSFEYFYLYCPSNYNSTREIANPSHYILHKFGLTISFFCHWQYHPDVCKGKQCAVQFHQINQAYEVINLYIKCL